MGTVATCAANVSVKWHYSQHLRIVSITLVITGGGTNNLKCGAQNCKDKISKYLSWPKLGNNTKVAKYCSIIV